jgi:prevent-host-death family protein
MAVSWNSRGSLFGVDAMKEITISKFRATCFAVLERVRRTRRPIRVTRFGKPLAEIMPPSETPRKKAALGSMVGTIRFKGDIIAPACDLEDWEVLNS